MCYNMWMLLFLFLFFPIYGVIMCDMEWRKHWTRALGVLFCSGTGSLQLHVPGEISLSFPRFFLLSNKVRLDSYDSIIYAKNSLGDF